MRLARSLLAACAVFATSLSAVAQQPPRTLVIPPQQVQRQPRDVHPNYASLAAGLVLFGFSYGLALSEPVRHGFSNDTRQRAIPFAGPWLSHVTWAWALDGVLQLGGAAFVTNAFVNPVSVAGTPAASSPASTGEHHVSIAAAF